MTSDPTDVEPLRLSRERVLERIAAAAQRVGRNRDEVTLIAVSKTVAAERLQAAVAAGLTILGENRVQEAETKVPQVPGATWHLVGPLQSNKARRALDLFDTIETVHSVALAGRLDGLLATGSERSRRAVLLQVNVDADPAKSGFLPEDLAAAIEGLNALERLDFRGLMTVGRLVEDPEQARPSFVALRTLSERLRGTWPRLGPALSMGMSDDFEAAVEEGATIVRVGRALFGERPPA